MNPTIYVDFRCLQDPAYQYSGISQHLAALLRTRGLSGLQNCEVVGLVDSHLAALPADFASLADTLTYSTNHSCGTRQAVFLDGSPLTHDFRSTLRFLSHSNYLKLAVVHDFIPLDWPGYLTTVSQRIELISKITRLRAFDFFFPVSEYTACRLSELTGVSSDRIRVTGASVRHSLYELRAVLRKTTCPYRAIEPYFLSVGGGDIRKNAEVAVEAVRQLNLIHERRIPLKIVGHYDDAYKRKLLQVAHHAEGDGFLQFASGISDEELVSLYAGGLATIVPSHIEGFSLPVVEASVCGCPVVASKCAAHMELVDQSDALFPSDDAATLTERLDAILSSPEERAALVASQAWLAPRFHENQVGKRFWDVVANAIDRRRKANANTATVVRVTKPRLAFLSPFPPDPAGSAFYTANTLRASRGIFDCDLYTDTPRPLLVTNGVRDAGRITIAPMTVGSYESILSVLGNSNYHTSSFEFFERFGGPCILHDAILTQMYFNRLGHHKFVAFSQRILGRPVSIQEVGRWLQDIDPPSLFLDLVVQQASPIIVHTKVQQTRIRERYGVNAEVNVCCSNLTFDEEELTASRKRLIREELGIASDDFVISTLGYVADAKGMHACLLASEILRSWNVPAKLRFVGNVGVMADEVREIAASCGIAEHVHCTDDFIDETDYRNFLLASDAGIQLRTYGFGQFSSALADCIVSGLPTMANTDLAESCDAPEYVVRVPDRFSPLQIAEHLALIWESRRDRAATDEARVNYLRTHNFGYYCKRLLEILGLA